MSMGLVMTKTKQLFKNSNFLKLLHYGNMVPKISNFILPSTPEEMK